MYQYLSVEEEEEQSRRNKVEWEIRKKAVKDAKKLEKTLEKMPHINDKELSKLKDLTIIISSRELKQVNKQVELFGEKYEVIRVSYTGLASGSAYTHYLKKISSKWWSNIF